MADRSATVRYPELIFGLVGPIGTDVGSVESVLRDELMAVGYDARTIKVTDEMMAFSVPLARSTDSNYYTDTKYKIDYADALCKLYEDRAALARVAVRAISNIRETISGSSTKIPDKGTAYIIRQLRLKFSLAVP